MWFAGLVIGAAVGGALGTLLRWDEAWIFFGAIGTVAGVLYRSKSTPAASDIERRVAALEREMEALKAGTARVEPRTAESAPQAAQPTQSAPEAQTVPPPATDEIAVASAPPVFAAPAAAPAPQAPAEPGWLWQKLFGGNILAKVGVVLLLFGVGSGLKLAMDFGLFPPTVRLLIATVAGLAMIAFGYSRMAAARHRMFGLALQGGGFGVLYLVTYFAFTRYGYVDAVVAFALFAVLGIACLMMAMRFEGEALAIFGISGAFLAPLLASSGSGNHVVLFSYYAVLDMMVLAVNAMRMWRALTITAFAFTLVTGMSWASARYTPAQFASTEGFLLLFSVLFSLAPIVPALLKRTSERHWANVLLVFGTPVAAAIAQNWLFEQSGYGRDALAWSALGAGVYYALLAAALFSSRIAVASVLAHSAIAVAFVTLAVPLAFGVQVTSAFWAIEGLALVWFGLMQQRTLPYAVGLLLQFAAGLHFITEWHDVRALPVLNGFYVGCAIVSACGAVSAWLTRRSGQWIRRESAQFAVGVAAIWALLWWLGANFSDIDKFAPARHQTALHVATLVITAWALMAFGTSAAWRGARYVALALAAVALVPALYEGALVASLPRHPLHHAMVFALPAAFVTVYAFLRRNERDGLSGMASAIHVYSVLLVAVVLVRESLWLATQLAPGVRLWKLIAWQLVPAAVTYALIHLNRHGVWPLATHRRAYLATAAPVMLALAVFAALYANFKLSGAGTALAYLPVASFFDIAQIGVLITLLAWSESARALVPNAKPFASGMFAALAFIWLSAMAMRLAHHWGGVPFQAHALLASGIAQSMLSLLWTAMALTLMISATRQVIRNRWFTGFALLGVVGAKFVLVDVVNKGTVTWTLSLIGVGLLILAASYFSPAPPRASPDAAPAT